MTTLLTDEFTPERAELARRDLIDLRRRIANGEAVPAEELARGIREIRIMYGKEAQSAVAARAAKEKKPAAKKAAAAKVDVDSLLNGILG